MEAVVGRHEGAVPQPVRVALLDQGPDLGVVADTRKVKAIINIIKQEMSGRQRRRGRRRRV